MREQGAEHAGEASERVGRSRGADEAIGHEALEQVAPDALAHARLARLDRGSARHDHPTIRRRDVAFHSELS